MMRTINYKISKSLNNNLWTNFILITAYHNAVYRKYFIFARNTAFHSEIGIPKGGIFVVEARILTD
jgi:hypothetical protein